MGLAEKVVLTQGDLTAMDVDAIVNAANNDLQLGGGLAGAIRRQGGEAIQQECDAIGSIPVGGAAITSGGKLRARFVIHAASMQLGGETTARALRSSTAHSLRIAAEHEFHSIAFPAVGTGIAGFPIPECAQIMLREVAEHLKRPTSLEKVYFVLFDPYALCTFERVWTEMIARGVSGNRVRNRRAVNALADKVRAELARYEHPLFVFDARPAQEGVEVEIRFAPPEPQVHVYLFLLRPREIESGQFPWIFQKQLYDCLHDFVIEMFTCNPQRQDQ